MERYYVASLKESILTVYGFYSSCLDSLFRTEGIVSIHLHAKSCCYTRNVAANIAKGEYTQFLTLKLSTGLAVIEIANSKYKQAEYQLCHSI